MGAGSSTVKAPPESPQDAREPGAAEAPALAKQETGSALAEEATAAAAPEPQGDHATSAAPASPKKNGQINDINGMPEGQVGDPYKEQDEAVILEVGQRDLENMFEKDDVSDTLVSQTEFFVVDVQESEQETIEEMPLSEDSTEELEQPSESSDVGYKKVFKFVGVKLTVKKDKNDKSDEVDDGGPNGSEDCQDYSSENELESQKQSILSIDNEKDDKQEKVGNITGYESTSSLKKFFSLGWIGWRKKSSIKKYKEDDEPEVSEKEKEQEVGKMDLVEIYEGKKEETAEHPTVSEPLPPNEAIEMLSEKEKVVRSPKDEAHEIQLSSEEKAAPLATEVFDEKIETIAEIHASSVEEQEQTENPSTDVEQVDVSLFPASATNETKLGVTGMLAKTSELVCTSKDVSETSPEESVLCQQREGITSEVEILSSQERGRLQGSPLKKLFSGTGLKKLSGKKYKGKKGDEEIKSQELGELTQVSVDSSETPEDQKGESSASSPDELAIEKGIVDTPQEVGIEDEGTISDSERRRESGVTPWASFKKMVTPKKRVRKLSESDKEDEIEKVKSATLSSTESTASDNQEELKGNGDDQKTEEPKRKVDTSVSWEALICVGSSKKRARKSSSSDEEGGPKVVSVEYYKSEDLGKNKESGTEITPIHSFEGDQGQINSSPELAGSPVEGEGVSTWVSFKRLVTPRKKSKSKMEERNEESIILSGTEHSASDIEPVKEESWVSIKKLIPGRRKKKFEGKQGQVPFEEDQTGVIEDDSDIPAVVPLSEYDAAEQEKNEARYAENIKAAKDLHKEKSGKLEEGLETGEHIEGLVHAATVTVVEGERAVTSIEERSPSWISTTITESVEEATDQPEEQTEEIFEQEVLVKRPATKTLRGTKDISRGPIDSELGLTSETVTAVKEATDEPKQPNGKIGEKEILVERPGTKSLREAKDTSRDLIVSELELTSEAVTAVKEAGERPKQPTEEIVEKEVLVERPGTKSLRDVKDTSRDPIVSKLELTSEAVTAAKDATNQPGQPIRKIFEKEKTEKKILVEKPVAKTFRGTKDSSRIPIVSELKLTSKAVTAAKEATDQPKQQTRKISEKEKSEKKALVEKPIAKTFRGTKDSSRIPIVSELKQTSVAVTAAKEARDGPKQPTGKIAEKEKFEKEVLVERPATKTLTEANDTSRGPIVSELGLTSEAVTAAKEARDGPKQPTGKIAEKKKSEKKVLFEKPGTKSFTGTKDTGRGPIVSELDPTSEASSSSSSAAMISALSDFSDSSYPGFATTVEKVDSHTPALTKQTQDGVQVAFENVKPSRDVSLREAKDTSRDLIVSELELPSEAVTAAKQAGEKPKQPTEEIVEEAKDMRRDLIVSKLEVTSEAVPAAEEATEAIYAEKITRASFASSSDYPSSIGMGSEPSWITDRVSSSSLSAAMISALSHFSDSSYTTGFATPMEEVDVDTPDLEALTKQTQDVLQVAFENVKQSRDVMLTTQSLETNSNYHQETNLTMGEAAVMHDEVQEKVQTRKTEDITINDEQDEIIEQITSETFDKLEAAESRIEVQECKTLNDFLTCQAERTIQTPQIPMKPRIPVEITTDEGTLVIHFQDKSIRQEQPVVFQEVSEGSDSAPALGSEVVQTKKTEEDILTIETQSSRIVQNVIQSSVELASAKESMIKTSLQDAIETKTEPKVKESLDSNGPKYDGPCDLPKSAPMES